MSLQDDKIAEATRVRDSAQAALTAANTSVTSATTAVNTAKTAVDSATANYATAQKVFTDANIALSTAKLAAYANKTDPVLAANVVKAQTALSSAQISVSKAATVLNSVKSVLAQRQYALKTAQATVTTATGRLAFAESALAAAKAAPPPPTGETQTISLQNYIAGYVRPDSPLRAVEFFRKDIVGSILSFPVSQNASSTGVTLRCQISCLVDAIVSLGAPFEAACSRFATQINSTVTIDKTIPDAITAKFVPADATTTTVVRPSLDIILRPSRGIFELTYKQAGTSL